MVCDKDKMGELLRRAMKMIELGELIRVRLIVISSAIEFEIAFYIAYDRAYYLHHRPLLLLF